jgi:hypothetical protein
MAEFSPTESVRLLRTKAAELHTFSLTGPGGDWFHISAAIAVIAQQLADFIEHVEPTLVLYVAHSENLIERVYALEGGDD